MSWKNTYRTPDEYLQENSKMKKWINQCWKCQAVGYKPEMPASPESHRHHEGVLDNAEFMNIRYRFKCLPLNLDGLCDVCCVYPTRPTVENNEIQESEG